jgi:chromosome segregation ATPase
MDKYHSLRNELENREKYCQEQSVKNNTLSSNLLSKESILNSKEMEIKNNELKYIHLSRQETEVQEKISEFLKAKKQFYEVEVGNITVRHCQEVKRLDEIISQQLEIGKNLQFEIDKLREMIVENEREKSEWKKKEYERYGVIEKLENDLKEVEEERDGLKEQLADVTVTFLLFSPLSLGLNLSVSVCFSE